MASMGDNVAKALRDLGEQPATKLGALKIKGYRGDVRCCPVASYLLSGLPSGYSVVVTNLSCVTSAPGVLTPWRTPVPKPVAEFIHEFDQGLHPSLDAQASRDIT